MDFYAGANLTSWHYQVSCTAEIVVKNMGFEYGILLKAIEHLGLRIFEVRSRRVLVQTPTRLLRWLILQ